eukprot:123852_1
MNDVDIHWTTGESVRVLGDYGVWELGTIRKTQIVSSCGAMFMTIEYYESMNCGVKTLVHISSYSGRIQKDPCAKNYKPKQNNKLQVKNNTYYKKIFGILNKMLGEQLPTSIVSVITDFVYVPNNSTIR